MKKKIVMLGAGGCFTPAVTRGLCEDPVFAGSEFVLVDVNPDRLRAAEAAVRRTLADGGAALTVRSTADRRRAFDGCDCVISSCEQSRYAYWLKDQSIPARFGVRQITAENGGPGGQIHGLRNIVLFKGICRDMAALCPDAWLMNFTNPVSFIATYVARFTPIRSVGLCHQVHGSMGVVSEMLGFEPGDLVPVTGGVNHFNWLLDIRKKGSSESVLPEFLEKVRSSTYWKKTRRNVPHQRLTLAILEACGVYPVGYDDHIAEYLPFLADPEEWTRHGLESNVESLLVKHGKKPKPADHGRYPFPRDGTHPYYREIPTAVLAALDKRRPTAFDAINIPNRGCIPNLPDNAIVDIPATVSNGAVKGIKVGPLPTFCAELCRRQITIHELVAQAAEEANRSLLVQAMALDPYVRSLTAATSIVDAFLKEYAGCLPAFR
jgi:alpha-galactosidase